jgi:hypothetical protein
MDYFLAKNTEDELITTSRKESYELLSEFLKTIHSKYEKGNVFPVYQYYPGFYADFPKRSTVTVTLRRSEDLIKNDQHKTFLSCVEQLEPEIAKRGDMEAVVIHASIHKEINKEYVFTVVLTYCNTKGREHHLVKLFNWTVNGGQLLAE